MTKTVAAIAGDDLDLENGHLRTAEQLHPWTRTSNGRGEYVGNTALRSAFFVACGLKR